MHAPESSIRASRRASALRLLAVGGAVCGSALLLAPAAGAQEPPDELPTRELRLTVESPPSLSSLIERRGAELRAQPVELEPPEQVLPPGPPTGEVYTWDDGGDTRRVFLQADLIVTRDGQIAASGTRVASAGAGHIMRVESASQADVESGPVFRSQSGALMTLPGGVLLIFDAGRSPAQAEAFFASQGISQDRLSPLGEIPNGFVIETAPGLASLELANALAGLDGVRISSPNWWQQHATR